MDHPNNIPREESAPEGTRRDRTESERSLAGGCQSLASRYESLLQVSRAVNAYRDPAQLFRALANELKHAVEFDFVGLFLYDESRNRVEMRVLEILDGPGITYPADLRPEDTITWWIYQNQKPVVISDPASETRFPRVMEVYRQRFSSRWTIDHSTRPLSFDIPNSGWGEHQPPSLSIFGIDSVFNSHRCRPAGK